MYLILRRNAQKNIIYLYFDEAWLRKRVTEEILGYLKLQNCQEQLSVD